MNSNSGNEASAHSRLTNPFFAVKVPAVVTFMLFILAAAVSNSGVANGLLPLLRFISLLILALGLYTSAMAGTRLAYSRWKWLTGQIAAGCIGFGGGFVWSASAFGAGFTLLMVGTLLCILLFAKELTQRVNQRIERQRKSAASRR